jgi:integrase
MNDYRPDMTIAEVFDDWSESNPRIRSEETRRLMRSSVKQFVAFLGQEPVLADMTEKSLTAFIQHRKALGRSPRTIEREAAKISGLWRWAARRGWCKAPMVSIRKSAPPTPTAWSRQELERLLVAARDYDGMMVNKRTRRFSRHLKVSTMFVALIRVLFDTGERITATRKLRWSDVDLPGRFVCFRADTRKGGASDNVQRISRKAARALKQWKSELEAAGEYSTTGTVFPERDRATYYEHYRRILALAGLPYTRRESFHKIRRSHATHLYVVGGDATLSLGHESDQMTREYYLDPKYVRRDYAADLLSGGIGQWLRRLARRVKVAFGYW